MCFFPVMNARVKLTVKVNLVYYANWNVAGPTTKTGWAKHEASVTAVNKTRLKGADRLSQCAIDRRTGTRTSPVEKIWRDGDRKLNTLELITAFGQLDFTSSVFCYSDVTYTEFTETVRSLLHAHAHTHIHTETLLCYPLFGQANTKANYCGCGRRNYWSDGHRPISQQTRDILITLNSNSDMIYNTVLTKVGIYLAHHSN